MRQLSLPLSCLPIQVVDNICGSWWDGSASMYTNLIYWQWITSVMNITNGNYDHYDRPLRVIKKAALVKWATDLVNTNIYWCERYPQVFKFRAWESGNVNSISTYMHLNPLNMNDLIKCPEVLMTQNKLGNIRWLSVQRWVSSECYGLLYIWYFFGHIYLGYCNHTSLLMNSIPHNVIRFN